MWKRSELLPEDIAAADEGLVDKGAINCLITEVVVPGFDWHDHQYMTREKLEELFGEDEEAVARYAPFLRPV